MTTTVVVLPDAELVLSEYVRMCIDELPEGAPREARVDAMRRALRAAVPAQLAEAAAAGSRTEAAALAEFTQYFARNYPGPSTIIGDPHWHAPRIFRAARHILRGLDHAAG